MRLTFKKLFVFSVALSVSTFAQASEPTRIGDHGDWTSYVFTEGGNKVCYMVSLPKKEEGDYTQRGDVFALITHRPAENSRDVFSYISGYTYETGSEVSMKIGAQNFKLFTQKDSAWATDDATDAKIADAVRRGSNIVVKGVSSRGTKTSDTFGLSGSSAAHQAISTECGI